jgi:hypothetical protein
MVVLQLDVPLVLEVRANLGHTVLKAGFAVVVRVGNGLIGRGNGVDGPGNGVIGRGNGVSGPGSGVSGQGNGVGNGVGNSVLRHRVPCIREMPIVELGDFMAFGGHIFPGAEMT